MSAIGRKALLAIEAVLDIALHAGDRAVQSGDITRRQRIPQRYLEQVLQALVRQGVLVGVRGPRGGYRLARERRRISLAEIVATVRTLEEGEAKAETAISELQSRVVQPIAEELEALLQSRLEALTIDDLVDRARAAGVQGEAAEHIDFTI